MLDPAPHREPRGSERWIVLGAFLVALGLLIAIVLDDYEPVRMAPVFMLLAWFPLIALHELGHAVAAHLLGWRVDEIVVGFGRPAARFVLLGVPFTVKMYPLGGYVSPGPRSLSGVRWRSALIYAAGPAAELTLAGGIALTLGPDLFVRHESLLLISAQSVAIAATLDGVTNLVPRRIRTERGESYTDGLGIVLSLLRPRLHFEVQVREGHEGRIMAAADAEGALEACEAAYRELGDDPHVRSVMIATLTRLGADATGRALPARVLERLSGGSAPGARPESRRDRPRRSR